MRFSKLRLQGFKSFVDPTELVIADGLTGVVGPNGCGKSNLLEALRWVMGENRPTAMRGGGMEDVIFAGSGSRPPRNQASVELVVDNRDHLAPAAFNQSETLEISRRITRDIGSAYNINGKSVRARDVSMLFADASTGAHSPGLVRQGQISEIINAKPAARRRILEEAAGISGLYQRRHEAELKLNAAENNLARVDDLIDGLESQLKSLERQAAQARRYREIAEELRRAEALLLCLRWKAAEAERARAEAELGEGTRASAKAEAAALETVRMREEVEAHLPPLREEAQIAGAVRQRLTIEREQLTAAEGRAREAIAALAARAAQLGQDLARERALSGDAEASAARLAEEEAGLQSAEGDHEGLLAAAQEAARQAGETLSREETKLDRQAEDAARLAARAAAVERRLAEARKLAARLEGEVRALVSAEAEVTDALAAAERTLADAADTEATAKSEAEAAEAALVEAETLRAARQEAEAETRAKLAEADGSVGALAAEVQALERLLAREAGDVAQIIDRVSVAPGYEAALGAALGDDLRAPALGDGPGSGWRNLNAGAGDGGLPPGTEALADNVKAPPALARRLAQIAVVAPEDGDRLQARLAPGQRLVSRAGDLWRWDGYRVIAEEAPTAMALRLEQQNRLKELSGTLAEARAAAEAARGAASGAKAALAEAAEAEQSARAARRGADQALADAGRVLSKAEADRERCRGKLAQQKELLAARQAERAEAKVAVEEALAAEAELEDVTAAREAVEAQRGKVDLARTAMLSARGKADEIRREAEARKKRLAEIARERATWATRLEAAEGRIADLETRIGETEAEREAAAGKPDEIAAQRTALSGDIERAEARAAKAADALAEAEAGLRRAEQAERMAERAASEAREARARLAGILEGAEAKVSEAADLVRSELSEEPDALAERMSPAPDADAKATDIEVAKLRRQRDALGAVNLRADEDAREVAEERDTLASEKADLDQAIAKLRAGVQELNREGRARLLAAFDEVNKKFASLFRHLFGGGEARLVMVESEDPLDAGLEILCQPPGKKLSTLSLLSGGEQTLTALSLIFAVFLSNPAPICVLDEVDAPLDDSNVARFCALLDEMVRLTNTRFLIITHNGITMSRMDRLFGVTMVEKGVSQLVSVDLRRAAEMVDG